MECLNQRSSSPMHPFSSEPRHQHSQQGRRKRQTCVQLRLLHISLAPEPQLTPAAATAILKGLTPATPPAPHAPNRRLRQTLAPAAARPTIQETPAAEIRQTSAVRAPDFGRPMSC
eukprot:1845735-Pleurochrysis_carterae.AAC.1